MGCCPSQTDDKPDEIQQGVKVITTTRPPSRSTASQLQSSSSDSVKDNASQDKPPEASFFPRPHPGKKPSTGSFRRRSGVRLAASLSSDILPVSPTQEVHIPRPPSVKREPFSPINRRSGVREASSSSSSIEADDQDVANNALPISSSEDEVLSQSKDASQNVSVSVSEIAALKSETVSDEEPKVRDSAKVNEEGAVTEETGSPQSNFDSGFGTSLGESIAIPSRTDNGPQAQEECSTLGDTLAVPSRTDNAGPQALEGSVVYDDKCLFYEQTQSIIQTPAQQPESLGPVDAAEDSTNYGTATGTQLMEDEKQFLHDTEQKETNEEAFGQTSGLIVSSSAHSDASDPSSSVVSATQEPTVHDDEGNSIATNDREIQKTASSLAIQSIRESLSKETAVMLDTDCNMEVTEVLPTRYVELLAEQSSQESKSDDRYPVENALHVKSDKTDSEQLATAAQEKETAKLHIEGGENNSVATAAELISDSQREADGVAKKPSVKTESSKEETKERQESQELLVTGKAIAIQKIQMPMKTRSLKDENSTASVKKASSKNAQNVFSKPSQSAAKKVKARQSRSFGTVSITRDNKEKRFSRKSSLNDIGKPVTSKNNSVMRGEPRFQSISNGAKNLMPIRTESKPKRTKNAFTVAKSHQPTKLLQAKGKAPALKQASKSLNNLPRTSKAKDVATKKAASLSHTALKSKPENTEQSIKQNADRISGEPSAAALKNDDTEALSDKSSMSMDSDVRLTKAIFEFLDNQETKIEGFTVYKDGIMKTSKDVISKMSPRRSPSTSIGAPNEKISVERIPSSSPIRIRSGSSIHSPERGISYGIASSSELSNSLVEEDGPSSRSGSPIQSGDLA